MGKLLLGVWCAVRGLIAGITSPAVRKTYWSALLILLGAGWGMSALLLWAVFHFIAIPAAASAWTELGLWFLRVVLSLGALLVAAVLALPLAQLIAPRFCAAPFFAGFSRRSPLRSQTLMSGRGLSIKASLEALARRLPRFAGVAVLGFASSFVPVVGGPLAAALHWSNAAWMVCSELLDPYFEARGLDHKRQVELMARHRGECLGFGLVCAPLLALPFVGPFFFAWVQAAAADLVADVLELDA